MEGADFDYCPIIFSCYGRIHVESACVLRILAQAAARRHGIIDYKSLLSRLYRNVGVEIWRRAALMVRTCVPKLSDLEVQLLTGVIDNVPLVGNVRVVGDFCTEQPSSCDFAD